MQEPRAEWLSSGTRGVPQEEGRDRSSCRPWAGAPGAVPAPPGTAACTGLGRSGGGFYSVLLASVQLLPVLPAPGPFLPAWPSAPLAKGPSLLGLICSCPSSACGVLFSPGDYVNTIDWFVLNSSGC